MCNAGAIVAAVGTGVSLYQDRENQKASIEYQSKVADANQALINKQAAANLRALTDRQEQTRASTAQQIQEISRRGQAARATAAAAAAESSTAGLSVEALQSNFLLQEAEALRSVKINQEFREQQFDIDAERIQAGGQAASLNNLPDFNVLPNFVGSALRIGQSAYQGYLAYEGR